MTTRVVVSCPEGSHWHLLVTVRDSLFDPKSKRYVPEQFTRVETHVLTQGESREINIWDSRSLVVEEVVPATPQAAV